MSKYEQWCNGWHSLYIDQCGERAFRGGKKLIKHYSWRRTVNSRLIWSTSKSFFTGLPWVTWGAARLGTLIHPRLFFFFFRDVQTCCRRKADNNTEGHGLEKVNALHNVCKQDQKSAAKWEPEGVYNVGWGALPFWNIRLTLTAVVDTGCGYWTADSRPSASEAPASIYRLHFASFNQYSRCQCFVFLCGVQLQCQNWPPFQHSLFLFKRPTDMSQHETRPPTDAIALLPRLLTITKNRWDWNLSVVSLLVIGRTPKLLVSTEGSGFAFQVICAKCERLYFKRAEPSTRPAGPAWCGFEPRARYHDGGLRYEMTH